MSEYVKKYASEEALRQSEQSSKDAGVSSSSESSMSEFSEDEAQVSEERVYQILYYVPKSTVE